MQGSGHAFTNRVKIYNFSSRCAFQNKSCVDNIQVSMKFTLLILLDYITYFYLLRCNRRCNNFCATILLRNYSAQIPKIPIRNIFLKLAKRSIT